MCVPAAGGVASPAVLIIHVTLDVDPAKRDDVIAAAGPLQEAVRAEAGCLRYVMSADTADPGRFYFSEMWEDDDALGAHMKQPHMRPFGKALQAAGLKESKAKKYTVGSESDLF
jgi:quinol monooxygenase YgiN